MGLLPVAHDDLSVLHYYTKLALLIYLITIGLYTCLTKFQYPTSVLLNILLNFFKLNNLFESLLITILKGGMHHFDVDKLIL